MTKTRWVSCGLASVWLASTASADVGKAWTAAKDHLPANTELVVGFDAAAIIGTKSFPQILELVAKEEREVQRGLELVKVACKIDLLTVVDGVILAVNAQTDDDDGAVFVQLKNVTRGAAETCFVSLLKAIGEKQPTVKQEGQLTTLSASGESIYFLWVAPDVVAITFEADDKQHLAKWTGQKGAFGKSAVATQIGKLDPKALAWGAFSFPKPFDDDDLKVLRGSGALTLGRGTFTLGARATFADAKSAASTVNQMKKAIARELKSKSTPPAARKFLKSIAVGTAGSDATLKVTASDAELGPLFHQVVTR